MQNRAGRWRVAERWSESVERGATGIGRVSPETPVRTDILRTSSLSGPKASKMAVADFHWFLCFSRLLTPHRFVSVPNGGEVVVCVLVPFGTQSVPRDWCRSHREVVTQLPYTLILRPCSLGLKGRSQWVEATLVFRSASGVRTCSYAPYEC